MHAIVLDTEQVELIRLAADMMHGALAARTHRIDPDGVVSRSLDLSRHKMRQVLRQLEKPALREWHNLDPAEKSDIIKLCRLMLELESDQERGAVHARLLAATTGQPERLPF